MAVARGCVDAPGPLLQGHVFAEEDRAWPLVEGMAADEAFQGRTLDRAKFSRGSACHPFEDLRLQPLGHDPHFFVDLHGRVLQVGVDADGQVGREGPGRRRPDENEGSSIGRIGKPPAEVALHGELDVN